jgi:hypothetical protein
MDATVRRYACYPAQDKTKAERPIHMNLVRRIAAKFSGGGALALWQDEGRQALREIS